MPKLHIFHSLFPISQRKKEKSHKDWPQTTKNMHGWEEIWDSSLIIFVLAIIVPEQIKVQLCYLEDSLETMQNRELWNPTCKLESEKKSICLNLSWFFFLSPCCWTKELPLGPSGTYRTGALPLWVLLGLKGTFHTWKCRELGGVESAFDKWQLPWSSLIII